MTKYFTQFEESGDVIGSTLTGWTLRGSATPAATPEYGTPSVKKRYLKFVPGSTADHACATWDTLDSDANRASFDILTLVNAADATATIFSLFARGQGSAPPTDYVRAKALFSAGNLTISIENRIASAAVASLASTSLGAWATTKPFWFRFRGSGATVTATAWAADTTEPSTPTVSTTTAVTAAGWLGVGGFGNGLTCPFNFFAAGTNGDIAVRPRTNTEYTAWLDSQSAIRCVLAEMSATGYDSGGSPYTKTVNVYLSNHGYTSQQQDTPSLRHYDNYIQQIPTFTREMSTALSGQATTGFGDLIISNPVQTIASGGVRDDWLRMKWNRNYLKLYLGDPSWPKHDFRLMIYGRVGMPSAPSLGQIKFPIADLSDALNVNISATRFSTGEFSDKFKPRLFSVVRALEIQIDSASLVGTINDGGVSSTLNDSTYRLHDCLPDAFVHIGGAKGLTVSSVDTGTETITASGTHNLSAGYRLQFTGGTPPAGLSTLTNYWVLAAGLTATAFRLTATEGSTTPVNLTSAATGASFNSFGYTFDAAAGTVELISPPAGRIFCFQPWDGVITGGPSDVMGAIAFTAAGLSLNFKDSASFTAAAAVDTTDAAAAGIATRIGELRTAASLIADLAVGSRSWFGFTPDGLMQVGSLSLPGATAVASFTESDVVRGSLRLVEVLRPVNYAESNITYNPWFNVGQPPIVPNIQLTGGDDYGVYSAEIAAGCQQWAPTSYGAGGVPIDDHPDQIDAAVLDNFASLSTSGSDLATRVINFRKHALGIFEFTTRLSAFNLNIGDTISLTHPRYGWKQYTGSDDASPDNTGTVEARYAVVIGIATDVARGTTKIKCFRRIPGYYPTADLN